MGMTVLICLTLPSSATHKVCLGPICMRVHTSQFSLQLMCREGEYMCMVASMAHTTANLSSWAPGELFLIFLLNFTGGLTPEEYSQQALSN